MWIAPFVEIPGKHAGTVEKEKFMYMNYCNFLMLFFVSWSLLAKFDAD